jgi:LysR family hydrogen peroxide-inducible transcriptional activator
MTLTQLNYIIAVDRCRNFAQAAKECFVTQPTLSMQIQKLEDYLQIIIFDRSKSPVEPTPMGRRVLENARKVMQGAQELEELSKSLRGEVSGEFLLAVIPTLAPYVLPLFVQKFVEEFPHVELKIFENQTDEIIKLLKEGKIDGAILATPLEVKEISEEHQSEFATPDDIVNIYKDIRTKDNYGHLIVDYKKPAKERFRTLNKIYKIEDNVSMAKEGL